MFMKIKGKSKDLKVITCNHFKSRLIGNIGKKKIKEVLLFPKCNSVHTFFMKQNIDIVMLSKDNTVIANYQNVSPYKIIWPKKGVKNILEFPAFENIYSVGEKITLKKEE